MAKSFTDQDANRASLHTRLLGKPDDFIIRDYWAREFTEVENVTCADTPDDLRRNAYGNCEWAHEQWHAQTDFPIPGCDTTEETDG